MPIPGEVRIHIGKLQWYDPRKNSFIDAVYHDDIRDELIADNNALGEYKYGRASGLLKNDVTCFHTYRGQQNWGAERAQWPDILFQYVPKERYFESKKPGWMYHDRRVVLDILNHPVLDFKEIPATISSKCEPAFLEAFTRLNQYILLRDIRARMPRDPTGQGRVEAPTGKGKDPIRLGTLSMSMTRLRERQGMITWGARAGSESIKEYMDGLLPRECLEQNSIKGFRKLYKYEIAAMHLQNTGAFPEKARKDRDRSKNEAKKEQMQRDLATKAQTLKEQHEKAQLMKVKDEKPEDHAAEKMKQSSNSVDGSSDDHLEAGNQYRVTISRQELKENTLTKFSSYNNYNPLFNQTGLEDEDDEGDDDEVDESDYDGDDDDAEGNTDEEFQESSQEQSSERSMIQEPSSDGFTNGDFAGENFINQAIWNEDAFQQGPTSQFEELYPFHREQEPALPAFANNFSHFQDMLGRGAGWPSSSSSHSSCISPSVLMKDSSSSSSSMTSAYQYEYATPYVNFGAIPTRRFTGRADVIMTHLLRETARNLPSLYPIHKHVLWPAQNQLFALTEGRVKLPPFQPELNYFHNVAILQVLLNRFYARYCPTRGPAPQLPKFVLEMKEWSHWDDGHSVDPFFHKIVMDYGFGMN